MARDDNPNWLDDAFDDEKAQAELERAHRSKNLTCLISALIIIVVFLAACFIGCGALMSLTF